MSDCRLVFACTITGQLFSLPGLFPLWTNLGFLIWGIFLGMCGHRNPQGYIPSDLFWTACDDCLNFCRIQSSVPALFLISLVCVYP